MRRSIPILAATLLSMAALAQAGQDKATEIAAAAKKPSESKGDECVFARTIYDWNAIDDETLIIYAPTRHDPYLVKLWRPVFGLRSEFSLGIEDADNDGRFCSFSRDSIIVRSPAGRPESYSLRTMQRLEEAQAKALLEGSKSRKKNGEPAVTMPEQSDVKSDKPQ